MKNFISEIFGKNLTKTTKTILIISFLSNCAGIPGNNVRLENYSEVNANKLVNLSVYIDLNNSLKKKPFNIAEVLGYYKEESADREFDFEIKTAIISKSPVNENSKCVIKISSNNTDDLDGWCGVYYIPTFLTLFTIPYYCQRNYEAKAKLISAEDNRVLKEYYLKDEVHEVWSSIMLLLAIPMTSLRDLKTPEAAKKIVENNISEALSRQILNDAAKFPECQKK